MAAGAVFPAFIRATYQETSDGVPAFERAIQTSVNRARKTAEISAEQIYQEVQRALAGGHSDFGITGMRASAAAADTRAQSARDSTGRYCGSRSGLQRRHTGRDRQCAPAC